MKHLTPTGWKPCTATKRPCKYAVAGELTPRVGGRYYAVEVEESDINHLITIWKGMTKRSEEFEKSKLARDRVREFHVTVFSPRETRALRKSGAKIEDTTFSFQPLGIGKVEEENNEAWFIVLDSKEANEYRRSLGLPPKDFHVTLGFDRKDIHNQSKGTETLQKIEFGSLSEKDRVNTSRKMSKMLRHSPESFGVEVDRAGWVEVASVISSLGITQKALEEVVNKDDKGRFEISEGRVRAVHGHSNKKIEIDFEKPKKLPKTLYHGTTREAAEKILKEGLKSMSRNFAHLSGDVTTAKTVAGRRKGERVILEVDVERAADEREFYISKNGVWLVEDIPAQFLKIQK